MSLENWTQAPAYTIAGVGPYAVLHPYAAGTLVVTVVDGQDRTPLVLGDYSVDPQATTAGAPEGNVTLAAGIATLHAGKQLVVDRRTPSQQGWLAQNGAREAGLEAQLDAIVLAVQELQVQMAGAVRVRGAAEPLAPVDATALIWQDGRPQAGPTVADIAGASAAAAAAIAAKVEAVDAAIAAVTAENSLIEWKGAWLTATAYEPSDVVRQNGSAYVCLVAHTSGTFATDLSAAKWEIFAQKGDPGAGTGDVVAANKGSEYTADKPTFLANVGAQAVSAILTALATLTNADAKIPGFTGGTGATTHDYPDAADLTATPAGIARRGNVSAYVLTKTKVLLGTITLSGNGSESFTALGSYAKHTFEYVDVRPGSDGALFYLRISRDGGVNYDFQVTDYRRAVLAAGASTPYQNQGLSSLIDLSSAVGTAAGEFGVSGKTEVRGLGTTGYKKFLTRTAFTAPDGLLLNFGSTGVPLFTDAINGVRFVFNYGQMQTGTILIWGEP